MCVCLLPLTFAESNEQIGLDLTDNICLQYCVSGSTGTRKMTSSFPCKTVKDSCKEIPCHVFCAVQYRAKPFVRDRHTHTHTQAQIQAHNRHRRRFRHQRQPQLRGIRHNTHSITERPLVSDTDRLGHRGRSGEFECGLLLVQINT